MTKLEMLEDILEGRNDVKKAQSNASPTLAPLAITWEQHYNADTWAQSSDL